jgi:hypothetical protein
MNRMNMMEQVHLVGEDEDEMYTGFNEYNDTEVSLKCFHV